jgi:hypothetical protein
LLHSGDIDMCGLLNICELEKRYSDYLFDRI